MTIHSSSKHWSTAVRKVAEEVDRKFPRNDWTSTYPGHGEGSAVGAYAIDFMCNKSDGDKISAYLWKHRKRLGLRYEIWDRRIIFFKSSAGRKLGVWTRYFNASSPNPSKNHTNHVHASFDTNFTYKPPIVDRIVNVIKPPSSPTGPVPHLTLLSLKAVVAALLAGKLLEVGLDGKQYQTLLNRFHTRSAFKYVLKVDGHLGAKSRRSTALAQVELCNRAGARLTKDDAWQVGDKPGQYHKDCDGLPGAQLLKVLAAKDSDK